MTFKLAGVRRWANSRIPSRAALYFHHPADIIRAFVKKDNFPWSAAAAEDLFSFSIKVSKELNKDFLIVY